MIPNDQITRSTDDGPPAMSRAKELPAPARAIIDTFVTHLDEALRGEQKKPFHDDHFTPGDGHQYCIHVDRSKTGDVTGTVRLVAPTDCSELQNGSLPVFALTVSQVRDEERRGTYSFLGVMTATRASWQDQSMPHSIFAGELYRAVIAHAYPDVVFSCWPNDGSMDTNFIMLNRAVQEQYGKSVFDLTPEVVVTFVHRTIEGRILTEAGYLPIIVSRGATEDNGITVEWVVGRHRDDARRILDVVHQSNPVKQTEEAFDFDETVQVG